MPSSFDVDPNSGTATYSIPLSLPPAPRNMRPKLALSYNSGAGAGYLGVGWSISGLSQITRCPQTVAQDTTPSPVTLSYNDRFCLDGQRLRLTSSETLSTYGQDGTTYQTELADFSNITAHGKQGNGPAYFTVQTKDGVTHQYGLTSQGGFSQVLAPGSNTVSMWLESSASDRFGNVIKYNYAPTPGGAVPFHITYKNGTWLNQVHVFFHYSPVYDWASHSELFNYLGYLYGTLVAQSTVLDRISVENGQNPVTVYEPTSYYSLTTGRLLLSGVKECIGHSLGSADCLNDIQFKYGGGALAPHPGLVLPATSMLSGSSGTPGASFFAQYDFDTQNADGAGKTDIAYYQSGVWNVALQTAAGYGAPINTGVTSSSAVFGDVFGTGKTGILANKAGSFSYYEYQGGAPFTETTTGIAVDSAVTQYVLADIDGDGMADLVALYQTANQVSIAVSLNTSTNGVISFAPAGTVYSIAGAPGVPIQSANLIAASPMNDGRLRTIDVNGDGRQDLLLTVTTAGGSTARTLISNGSSAWLSTGQTFSVSGAVLPLNWNDDNCTDFYNAGKIYISGCDGSVAAQISVASNVVATMDWDGDGRTDLLVPNGATLGVYRSKGNAVGPLEATSIPYSASYSYFELDANADGQEDLGYIDLSVAAHPVSYWANVSTVSPDLMTDVIDFNNQVRTAVHLTYTPLLKTDYLNDLAVPMGYKAYARSDSVVTSVQRQDNAPPIGSPPYGSRYTQTLSYRNGWISNWGRGFTGFGAVFTTDSRNGSQRLQTYGLAFPYTGMPIDDGLYQDSTFSYPVTDQFATLGQTVLDSTTNNQRVFPFVSNLTTSQYEVGGLKNGDLESTTSVTTTFDNYGNATNIATTVADNDTDPPYGGLTWTTTTATTFPIPPAALSNWCLSLPTVVQTTNASPGTTPIMREVDFTPDYVNCRETTKITEPTSAAYKVTESYGFDSFGNISSTTVTGVGMGGASPATRITLTDWGTSGVLPETIQDPSLAVTHFTYNMDFGVPLTMTDPNNLLTTWEYSDGFGRKTKETRPDGTYTQWVYADCSAFNCVLPNVIGMYIQETIYNADATVQANNTYYLDRDNRVVLSQIQALQSGAFNRTEVAYDTFGKIAQQYMPCVWQDVSTHCPYSTTTKYDLRNRPYQVQRPINQSNPSLQTTTIAYQGDNTIVTDPLLNQTTTISTPVGQVGQSIDSTGYAVSRTFDGFGSLVTVTDSQSNPLFTASYDYGVSAFQRDATDMDLDTSTAAGQHRHFNYSALGELTSWSDAKGQSFSMTYDALSRPLTRVEPDGVSTWIYGATPASHNVGKLQCVLGFSGANCAATGVGFKATYAYDGVARPQTVTYTTDATYQVDYAYNAQGKLDTLTYPTSTSGYRLKLQYFYQNGLLNKIADFNAPATVFWQGNTINPFNEVTQFTLGNGTVVNRTFDNVTGWLTTNQAGPGGGTGRQNEAYSYDLMGNVTLRQNLNVGLSESLCYDSQYRLDHTTATTQCSATPSLQMSYNALGNISTKSDVANNATPWTYDPAKKHALTQAGNFSYTYDANGNAATRNGQSITWTSFNYPSVINDIGKSLTFSYDPNRQRFMQVYTNPTANETTMYVGGLLEKVTVGTTTVWRHYIRVGNDLVAIVARPSTGSNATWYVLEDHQGSVTKILDSTGAAYLSESYAPFGTRRDPSTWSGATQCPDLGAIAAITRIGYTGQEAVGGVSMGLNHMNGRVQDAFTGRFLSADPFIPDPSNNPSYNRYSYVNNNPVTLIDPTGFESDGNTVYVTAPSYNDPNKNRGDSYPTSFGSHAPAPSPVAPKVAKVSSKKSLAKTLLKVALELYCSLVPEVKVSMGGGELQAFLFNIGLDAGADTGFTTRGQLYVSGFLAGGGGGGLGFNVLGGDGGGYGHTPSGLSHETGVIVFGSLGYYRSVGGNIQLTRNSASASIQRSFKASPRWGGGLGGGLMGGGYVSGTAATEGICTSTGSSGGGTQ